MTVATTRIVWISHRASEIHAKHPQGSYHVAQKQAGKEWTKAHPKKKPAKRHHKK